MRPQACWRRVRLGGAAWTTTRGRVWPKLATGCVWAHRRHALLLKPATFKSVGRKNNAMRLKGYCKGGMEPGLRLRESSRRSGPPLSGLRIQSLTKAPRTPLLQDFKGVKKSDRCTRITSSSRNSVQMIKENRPGIKEFFSGQQIWAGQEETRRRGRSGFIAWAPSGAMPRTRPEAHKFLPVAISPDFTVQSRKTLS
jgi:hypothetical protein